MAQIKVLNDEDGKQQAKEMDAYFTAREKLVRDQGGKSTEGFYVSNGKAKGLSEND